MYRLFQTFMFINQFLPFGDVFRVVNPIRYLFHFIIYFPVFRCFPVFGISWLIKSFLDFLKLLV